MKPKLTQYYTVRWRDPASREKRFEALDLAYGFWRSIPATWKPTLWESTLLDWVDE